MTHPPIVSAGEWQVARDKLLVKEQASLHAREALTAERRKLPMVEITKPYAFDGPNGPSTLLDLFDGCRQLVVYHFMFAPGWDEGCEGCSYAADNFGHPAHLTARDVSFVLVSRAPLPKLLRYEERMGWTFPWFSSFGSDFNTDFGVTKGEEENFGLSVFLRDGDRVFRTYFAEGDGVGVLLSSSNVMDLMPLAWEDGDMGWLHRHDAYEQQPDAA